MKISLSAFPSAALSFFLIASSSAIAVDMQQAIEGCKARVGMPIVVSCIRSGASLTSCREKAKPTVVACVRQTLARAADGQKRPQVGKIPAVAEVPLPSFPSPRSLAENAATPPDQKPSAERPIPVSTGARIALVVGNGDYASVAKLANPSRDGQSVADALQRIGYDVKFVKDGTLEATKSAISQFIEKAPTADIAVFYYAGHGVEAQGENWLIPTDARIVGERSIVSEAINLREITSEISRASNLGLVILDACRDNPFVVSTSPPSPTAAASSRKTTTRTLGKGLAPVAPTGNVFVAFAAKDGTVANDGEGQHSPFTDALLRHIERRGLEVSSLFRIVRDEVVAVTNGSQQPFVYGSLPSRSIYLGFPPDDANRVDDPIPTQPSPKFTDKDRERVQKVASDKRFVLPEFQIADADKHISAAFSSFVGVWSSKIGNSGGVGRQILFIVSNVGADGLATGFYGWGPPQAKSWDQGAANSVGFSGYIRDDLLPFRLNISSARTVANAAWVKLGRDGTLALQVQNAEGKTTWNTLYPIWRLEAGASR